ncbi:MAG: PAS domain S-box protein [Proteobacteria bacterium]|nr:PAS domain S-box protein [Pseudomonadota bacterium]MBU1640459.1 PAS domain S-box protein [Pseudomonadota bacterium]
MHDRQLQPDTTKVFLTFALLFLPFIVVLVVILATFTNQSITKDMAALQISNFSHLESGANSIQHDIAMAISDISYLQNDADLHEYVLSKDKKHLSRAAASIQRFSQTRKIYDQIRFINKKGKEEIRVSFDQGLHRLVAPEHLQDKSQRYYFTDTFRLQADEIYISPLDLNIDHGKIEEPHKPMLRFGMVIVDKQGQKQGVIIINYLARLLLNHYKEAVHASSLSGKHSHFPGNAMLVNQDGYWLLSPDKADEWGFMLGRQTTMAQKFPEAWQQIQAENSGSIITPAGCFFFTTVYPLGEHHLSSTGAMPPPGLSRKELTATDYKWKLISHVPARELRAVNSYSHRFPWLLFTAMIILAAPLLWVMAWSRNHHHLTTLNLRHREEQYRLLYHLAPMPYQSLDEKGHLLDINQAWLHTLGYEEDEVVGRPFADFIIQEQKAEFPLHFSKLTEIGQTHNFLLTLLHKNGTSILTSLNGQVIRDNEGNVLQTQCVFQDVTSQHKAMSELTSNLALLETIINTIPSIICLKDDKGRWLLANHLYLDICGLQGVNYQGKTDSELAWHSTRLKDELLSSKKEDAKVWEEGKTMRSEKAITLPDNQDEAFFDIVRQPNYRDGKPDNLLMVGFDITARKKNENSSRINQMRFQALCQLHRMADQDVNALHAFALEAAGTLSASKIGYLHCFAGKNRPPSFITWSLAGPIPCQTPENAPHNPEGMGLWQECLTSRTAVVHNNYQTLASHHGLPLGHVPIIHHMNVPLLDGDTVIGVLGVANKERPYSADDAEQLMLFAANIMVIFNQRQFSMALEQSQEEWLRTFDAISDVVTIQDKGMNIIKVNKAGALILGMPGEEIIGKKCYEIFHGADIPCPGCPIQDALHPFTPYLKEIYHEKLAKTFLVNASPIVDDQGNATSVAHFAKDITATKHLEMQLRQSQKMEAVGTLAGGMAHDFNNILTAVSGYVQLAMMKIPAAAPAFSDLEEVKKAADRATELVRQLMLFARKKQLRLVAVDMNATIQGILKMLQRLIGEDITIITDLSQDLWTVMGDVGNIEQVLMNLALNARDAMTDGGKLTLRTKNMEVLPQDIPAESPILPGKYVMIGVEDTGTGMDPVTCDHVFEPFFTTKEPGKGTGLGLAVAYSIIEEHKGWFEVESSPNQGSLFRFCLPAISAAAAPSALLHNSINPAQLKGHGERILLVEDEVILNEFAFKALTRYGYQVRSTYNAEEALTIWKKEQGNFDLLFSDVVLPGKNGLQLAEELRSRNPLLKILLTSGYTEQKSQAPLIKEKKIPFLEKPYDTVRLLQKIKAILLSL